MADRMHLTYFTKSHLTVIVNRVKCHLSKSGNRQMHRWSVLDPEETQNRFLARL